MGGNRVIRVHEAQTQRHEPDKCVRSNVRKSPIDGSKQFGVAEDGDTGGCPSFCVDARNL